MDPALQRLVILLASFGYKEDFVSEHWSGDWRNKRWYGFEGPDKSVLQVVRANTYARIVNFGDGAFAFGRCTSTEHPERPKTDFFKGSLEMQDASLEIVIKLLKVAFNMQEEREAA